MFNLYLSTANPDGLLPYSGVSLDFTCFYTTSGSNHQMQSRCVCVCVIPTWLICIWLLVTFWEQSDLKKKMVRKTCVCANIIKQATALSTFTASCSHHSCVFGCAPGGKLGQKKIAVFFNLITCCVIAWWSSFGQTVKTTQQQKNCALATLFQKVFSTFMWW